MTMILEQVSQPKKKDIRDLLRQTASLHAEWIKFTKSEFTLSEEEFRIAKESILSLGNILKKINFDLIGN